MMMHLKIFPCAMPNCAMCKSGCWISMPAGLAADLVAWWHKIEGLPKITPLYRGDTIVPGQQSNVKLAFHTGKGLQS